MSFREQLQSVLFSVAVTVISKALLLRDRFTPGSVDRNLPSSARTIFFDSGDQRLVGSIVEADETGPVLLICHGIGEVVEYWGRVQQYLQDRGVSSMVFNYSGYGRSSGSIRALHCDRDLISAYNEIRRRAGTQRLVFLLGFSMGSGVAAQGAACLDPAIAGPFLCEAFTFFREATKAAGFPSWLARFAPDIWNTVNEVSRLTIPTYVVHSQADKLFPVSMAQEIATACGQNGEMVLLSRAAHDDIYRRPSDEYRLPIVNRVHAAAAMSRLTPAE